MPRKGLRPRDRRPAPDADYKFKSVLVSRLINKLDHQGKKSVAERVMYDALDIVADRTKENVIIGHMIPAGTGLQAREKLMELAAQAALASQQ